MRLKVLCDNNTYIDEYYLAEPAVSYYIEDGGERILFDAGYSDVYLKNAADMGIDLGAVTKIVLSHGHDDHTRGLPYLFDDFDLSGAELIAHGDTFAPKMMGDLSIGSPMSAEDIAARCRLNIQNGPVKLTENLTYLGEVPETFVFEKRRPIGCRTTEKGSEPDLIMEDTAIVHRGEDGLFIITGCSHSGICNIVEYAKKVCGDDRVVGVIGGFHLLSINDRAEKTADYLEKQNIKHLYPCHCVSLDVKIELGRRMKIGEVGVGMELKI